MAGMFERFTKAARDSVSIARRSAGYRGSQYIDDEDMLVGILSSDRCIEPHLGIPAEAIDWLIFDLHRESERAARSYVYSQLPISHAVRAQFTSADQEATRRKHEKIGLSHLLFGSFQSHNLSKVVLTAIGFDLREAAKLVFECPVDAVAEPEDSKAKSGPRTKSAVQQISQQWRDPVEAQICFQEVREIIARSLDLASRGDHARAYAT